MKKGLKEAPILGLSILRKICCEPFSWFKGPVEKSNYTRPLETHIAFDFFVSRLVSRQAHRLKSHLGLLKELTNNKAFRWPRVEASFTTVHRCQEASKLRNMENLHPFHSQKSLQWVPSRELTHLGSKVSWRVFKPLLLGS